MKSTFQPLKTRRLIRVAGALGLLAGLQRIMPAYAFENIVLKAGPVGDAAVDEIDLLIRELPLQLGKRRGFVITVNGAIPGPLVGLREGGATILRVTNGLKEDTSIH